MYIVVNPINNTVNIRIMPLLLKNSYEHYLAQ